ncbi:MAG TPA: PAS domain S-box protein [Methylibium sp.]|uniref:PAS domain-containing hybrid sensor histidine kinase/response regulator n=1 Tax=Methylibium sp. TaxID=2067992 RepID=UPI002DBA40C4|nr:PAS domain S-box protein [Methylibium sp.]HEU4460458.1 PAS domain S-box protein [Methylibium sp.]
MKNGSSSSKSARSQQVAPRIVWLFYGCAAAVSLALGAAALGVPGPAAVSEDDRLWMAAIAALQALAFLASAKIVLRTQRAEGGAVFSCFTALGSVTASALLTAPDAALLLLGLHGFLVCVCAVFAGRRAALVLAALALLACALVGALRGAGASGLALVMAPSLTVTGLLIGLVSKLALSHSISKLRQREQRFERLLNIAADWYWELDAGLRFRVMAPIGKNAIAPDEIDRTIGRHPWETLQPDEPDLAVQRAHRADLEAQRPFRNHVALRTGPAGRRDYISASGEPMFDANGRFTGYWGISRVVTEEVHAQRAIRASAERYHQLFDRSPTPMVAHRLGVAVEANEAAARLLGYPDARATLGVDFSRHFPEGEARERALARVARIAADPGGATVEPNDTTLVRLDGQKLDVQLTSLRVELDDGPAVLTICQDFTARRAAEHALRHSQTLLERLFDTTPDAVTLAEYVSGRYLMVNERFTQVLGWTRAEAIGRSTLELGIYHDVNERKALRDTLRAHGAMSDRLMNFRTKAGGVVTMRVSAALLTFDAVDYVVAVARDVSHSEQARQEHEAILRYASVGIGFTRERVIVQANPRFEEMFGWPRGSLAGQPGAVVWPNDDDYAEAGAVAGPLLSTGQPYETERPMRRRDGSSFWCRLSARAVDPSDPSHGGTIWIVEDVTERRMVQQSLAAARDAAEAASRAKSAFLANTSHEIRTPLNGLLGLARLARQPGLADEERQRFLDQILDSARTLSGVITDILDLSKVEAGRLSLDTVVFDLRALLEALGDSTEALAQAKGLKLRRAIDEALPRVVRGDPVRVRQILGNFLGNALKFTERGEITLIASRGPGDLVHVVVADTGPGIDEATQARLFRPFVQADDSMTRRHGGTGLGLSICRELATLMGGAVGVGSHPKRGSRFWADLPLPAVDGAELEGHDPSGFDEPIEGARVLVVEDNAVNLLIVRAMLEGWGLVVEEAADGQQALDAVIEAARRGRAYDAVLMDVQMPVMSGHDAARALRRRPEGTRLPIVALTAAALTSERDQALAAGMDAFLTKPIDADQLRQVLARMLKGRARA